MMGREGRRREGNGTNKSYILRERKVIEGEDLGDTASIL